MKNLTTVLASVLLVALPVFSFEESSCFDGSMVFPNGDPTGVSPRAIALYGDRIAVASGDGQIAVIRIVPGIGWGTATLEWSIGGFSAGEVSVDIQGPYLAVGFRGVKVVLFTRSGSAWVQTHEFLAPDEGQFGDSVALSNGATPSFLAIGAPAEDGDVVFSGSVYIYRLSDFSLEARLLPPPPYDGSTGRFGESVAFRGGVQVFVGQPGLSSVFAADAANGWEVTHLLGTLPEHSLLGKQVSADGPNVVFAGGAPLADVLSVTDAGKVFVHNLAPVGEIVLEHPSPMFGDKLGDGAFSVLRGTGSTFTVVVGASARNNDTGGVFRWRCGEVCRFTDLTPPAPFIPGDLFGFAVTANDQFWAAVSPNHFEGTPTTSFGMVCVGPMASTIFTDGFESGDTSRWSSTVGG